MKSQQHNKGELKTLTVNIEKPVVESMAIMAANSKMPIEELVVIALKRFISSHSDYLGNMPRGE